MKRSLASVLLLSWPLLLDALAGLARAEATSPVASGDGFELRAATSHPMKYLLALPRGYKRESGRKWPALICVTGSGGDVVDNAERFRQARGDIPFVLVAPCTFSNLNWLSPAMRRRFREVYTDDEIDGVGPPLAWDEAGILAIIHDLKASHDIEDRVYVTGCSGGGLAAYMMVFRHPDLLAGAAPACANFFREDYRRLKGRFPPEVLNFPVRQIAGEQDPLRRSRFVLPIACLGLAVGYVLWKRTRMLSWKKTLAVVAGVAALAVFLLSYYDERLSGMDAQADAAAELLRDLGYPDVTRTIVPGMGHDAAPDQVIAAFAPYWEKAAPRR